MQTITHRLIVQIKNYENFDVILNIPYRLMVGDILQSEAFTDSDDFKMVIEDEDKREYITIKKAKEFDVYFSVHEYFVVKKIYTTACGKYNNHSEIQCLMIPVKFDGFIN